MATRFPPENNKGLIRQYLAHQQTMPYEVTKPASSEPDLTASPLILSDTYHFQALPELPAQAIPEIPGIPVQAMPVVQPAKKPQLLRIVAAVLAGVLALSTYFIWHASSPSTTATAIVNTTQQPSNLAPATTTLKTASSVPGATATGEIQVYIVGAVKRPGVYSLQANARVYQLLQMAGGPLPEANLVTLNLATRLTDGQEIYVARIGETPPASTGSTSSTNITGTTGGITASTATQVNINTASATDLRQGLHISSTTAQAIINYRSQHGPFTSVEELLQVVSQSIYKKIKDQVKLA